MQRKSNRIKVKNLPVNQQFGKKAEKTEGLAFKPRYFTIHYILHYSVTMVLCNKKREKAFSLFLFIL